MTPEPYTATLREHGDEFARIAKQIEDLEELKEHWARPIERQAHALLKARRAYARSGMYPTLRETSDTNCWFDVSNGIDTGDDFGASLTWDELQQDPEQAALDTAKAIKAHELRAAREQAKRLEARIAQLQDESEAS